MEFFEAIRPALDSLLAVVITTVFSYVGLQIRSLYKRYADTQEKQIAVQDTVRYINQVYADLNGADKLSQAMSHLQGLLSRKGITVDNAEMRMMIEAAVNGLKGESTTPATTVKTDAGA